MNENEGFVISAIVVAVLVVGIAYRLPDIFLSVEEPSTAVSDNPCFQDAYEAERLGSGWSVESEACAALKLHSDYVANLASSQVEDTGHPLTSNP